MRRALATAPFSSDFPTALAFPLKSLGLRPTPSACSLHRGAISFSLFCFCAVDVSLRAPPIYKASGRPSLQLSLSRPTDLCESERVWSMLCFPASTVTRRSFFEKRRALTLGLGYTLLPGVNSDNAHRLRARIPKARVSRCGKPNGRAFFVLRGRYRRFVKLYLR